MLAFPVAQTVKNLPVMQETWVQPLGGEVSLALHDDGSSPDCPVIISVIVLGNLMPKYLLLLTLKNFYPAHSLGKTVKALIRTCVHSSACRCVVF